MIILIQFWESSRLTREISDLLWVRGSDLHAIERRPELEISHDIECEAAQPEHQIKQSLKWQVLQLLNEERDVALQRRLSLADHLVAESCTYDFPELRVVAVTCVGEESRDATWW